MNELELKTELTPAYQHLVVPLDHNHPALLRSQLAEAEALVARISTLKRKASQTLSEALQGALPAKDKSLTELDRKVQLEASTASERYVADILSDYEKKLYNRISLGQSMLSSMTEEIKRQI